MDPDAAPRTPPRFVPTLTEVVQPAFVAPADVAAPPPKASPPQEPIVAPEPVEPATPLPDVVERLENQIIHRVMQRVDVALERSLHAAVAAMVQQHTHALVPRLREEIEFVVRQAVADAVARELAEREP